MNVYLIYLRYVNMCLLVCTSVLLLATGCAKHMPVSPVDATTAQQIWQNYEQVCAAYATPLALHTSYRVHMSLRYGKEGDTRRVTAVLWGNTLDQLRLDVSAGVGVPVAHILDDDTYFAFYSPQEKRVYYHNGLQKPLLNAGVPMPFGVNDLAALLLGQYGRVFGSQTVDMAKNHSVQAGAGVQGIRYTLAENKGTLVLDTQGLPRTWQDEEHGGWTLHMEYDDATHPLPHKLEITHGDGQRAIVLVKDRQFPPVPYTDAQMRLMYPDDTPVIPLARLHQARR